MTLAVSVKLFTRRFPEFRDTDAGLLEECLTEAELFVDAKVWGARREAGIKMRAAHLVAMNPLGEKARLKKDDSTTIYEKQFKTMRNAVTAGGRNT